VDLEKPISDSKSNLAAGTGRCAPYRRDRALPQMVGAGQPISSSQFQNAMAQVEMGDLFLPPDC